MDDDMAPEVFAGRLWQAIQDAGHTSIRGSAKAADMHYETLYKYLRPHKKNGKTFPPQIPSATVIDRLIRRLGIDVLTLFPTPNPGRSAPGPGPQAGRSSHSPRRLLD